MAVDTTALAAARLQRLRERLAPLDPPPLADYPTDVLEWLQPGKSASPWDDALGEEAPSAKPAAGHPRWSDICLPLLPEDLELMKRLGEWMALAATHALFRCRPSLSGPQAASLAGGVLLDGGCRILHLDGFRRPGRGSPHCAFEISIVAALDGVHGALARTVWFGDGPSLPDPEPGAGYCRQLQRLAAGQQDRVPLTWAGPTPLAGRLDSPPPAGSAVAVHSADPAGEAPSFADTLYIDPPQSLLLTATPDIHPVPIPGLAAPASALLHR